VDDDRYNRYLNNYASQSDPKGSTNAKKSLLDINWGSGKSLSDVKVKLGLRGLSNSTAAMLAIFIIALCLVGLWSYSSDFRALVTGKSEGGAATLVKGEDKNDSSGSAPMDVDEGLGEGAGKNANIDSSQNGGQIYVYISGAVENPNVYEVASGARVVDVLEAAGGFLNTAAHEAINLAAELEDGTHIHILTKKEFEESGGSVGAVIGSMNLSGGAGIGGSGNAAAGMTQEGLVNLNTADSTVLQTLPGIGPVTADKIVQDRERNGPYSSLKDLTRVSGIGPKRVEGLEGIASVGP